LLGALGANLAIAVTKFVVGVMTGSTVMVAEGIHSLVDTGDSGLMLLGRSRSRRAPNDAHPFGYGMELYFWSFLVAMVIFGGGGCLSIYEGVRALLHPRAVAKLWPNYVVIGAAAIFETASLAIGLREFTAYRREMRFSGSMLDVMHESKNPAIFVTVLEDVAALAGLAVAAGGLALSYALSAPAIDAAASILIGMILMLEAALLGVECRSLITGESGRPMLIAEIRRIVSRCGDGLSANAIQTLQLGPDTLLVFVSVRIPRTLSTAALEDRAEQLTVALRRASPTIKHVAFYIEGSEKWR
jgi:cation diffusion facilitator family transporter